MDETAAFVHPSISSIRASIHLSIRPFVCSSILLSFCPSKCLSVCLCLSIYLPARPSIRPSVCPCANIQSARNAYHGNQQLEEDHLLDEDGFLRYQTLHAAAAPPRPSWLGRLDVGWSTCRGMASSTATSQHATC